jgi:hypothetical protein
MLQPNVKRERDQETMDYSSFLSEESPFNLAGAAIAYIHLLNLKTYCTES